MPLLSLNSDVLDSALSYLTSSDALHLALTSREALAAATPQLLSCVVLHRQNHIPGFMSFMLADSITRIPCLRNLTIWESAASFLADLSAFQHLLELATILQQAKQLRRLFLEECETMLRRSRELMDALALLPNLDDICFRPVGRYTMALLGGIASRPRKVMLGCLYPVQDTDDDDYGAPVEPNDFLQVTARNLEVLQLVNCSDLFSNIRAETRCNAVHTLELTSIDLIQLPVFSRTFPNVLHLLIEAPFSYSMLDAQRVIDWQHLDSVITSTDLPLPTTIRRLGTVGGFMEFRNDLALELTSEYIRHAYPTVLDLRFRFTSARGTLSHICDATSESVKYLNLIAIGPFRDTFSEDLTSIKGTGPTDLWTDISEEERWLWSRLACWTGSSLIGFSLRYLESWDPLSDDHILRPKTMASIIATFLPQLKYVGFHVEPFDMADIQRFDLLKTWFCVKSRPPSQVPELEELSAEEGGRVQCMLWDTQANGTH